VTNIHPSLDGMAVPIENLKPLPNNPRQGNVDAIMRSYSRFGQLKPIVVKADGDGSFVVMSGNHQLEAARRLGWDRLAVTEMTGSDDEAIAFALVENRFGELGSIDKERLHDHIVDVYETMPDLFDSVGWDDFEIASMGVDVETVGGGMAANGVAGGYIPPVLTDPTLAPTVTTPLTPDEAPKYEAPKGIDQTAAVTGGSTVTGQAGTKQAVFSYSIVFDDASQMGRWWDFVRWLRAQPAYDGDTISAKLMSFIDAHSEV
jgi:hypothetical protein